MSTDTTTRHPLASVVKYGKTLTTLLRRAKSKAHSIGRGSNVYEKVEKVIKEIGELSREQGPASFPEESLARIHKKIGDILQELATFEPDNKSKYEDLSRMVNGLKPGKDQSSGAAASSWSSFNTDPYGQPWSCYDQPAHFELAYEGLQEKEKQCLLCFMLFPGGAEIKKRELFHIWVGIDQIESPLVGDDMLAELVLKGFIERVIVNKRLYSRYKIHKSVHTFLSDLDPVGSFSQTSSWSVMHNRQIQAAGTGAPPELYVRSDTLKTSDPRSGDKSGREAGEIEILLNIKQNALNANRIENINLKMKNVKVLHLGSWRPDPENYIVGEGIDSLKEELKHVASLSLHGVSGIKKLPDSVYRLHNLKVLDLRACHNLEMINGVEIVSLKNLTHLDLSECYLLDHVPKGINSLNHLQVVKGFVINPIPQAKKVDASPEINASPCAFSDLSKLANLIKLTVRTRRLSFPTAEDLGILCELQQLISLRISWVASSNDCQPYGGIGSLFPNKLQKLELQAAPDGMASRLLALISTTSLDNCLKKLYIRGGGFSDLCTQKHQLPRVKALHLKHLYELYLDWDKFRLSFPGLTSLEIIGCPNLVFFPCDGNGAWESTDSDQQLS